MGRWVGLAVLAVGVACGGLWVYAVVGRDGVWLFCMALVMVVVFGLMGLLGGPEDEPGHRRGDDGATGSAELKASRGAAPNTPGTGRGTSMKMLKEILAGVMAALRVGRRAGLNAWREKRMARWGERKLRLGWDEPGGNPGAGVEAERAGLGPVFVVMWDAISTTLAMRSREFIYDHERELAIGERDLREHVLSDLAVASEADETARLAVVRARDAGGGAYGEESEAMIEAAALSHALEEVRKAWFNLHRDSWELVDVESLKRLITVLNARAAIHRAEAAVWLKAVEICGSLAAVESGVAWTSVPVPFTLPSESLPEITRRLHEAAATGLGLSVSDGDINRLLMGWRE